MQVLKRSMISAQAIANVFLNAKRISNLLLLFKKLWVKANGYTFLRLDGLLIEQLLNFLP